MTRATIIGATIAILTMTGTAFADQQPKLPPRPQPTKAFQARATMPAAQEDRVVYMVAEKQCDLPPPEKVAALRASCDRLEADLFAGIDAVTEDDTMWGWSGRDSLRGGNGFITSSIITTYFGIHSK